MKSFLKTILLCSLCIIFATQISFAVTGTTVITHGWMPFANENDLESNAKWTLTMGMAIGERIGKSTLYTVVNGVLTENPDYSFPGDGSIEGTGEVVIVFSWLPEADKPNFGYAEGAADALAATLLQGAIDSKWDLDQLHFIGHSRGAVVFSETIQRLGLYNNNANTLPSGISIDSDIHFTTLDAHPWDNETGDCIGEPLSAEDNNVNSDNIGIGVVCWENVQYVDNYRQGNCGGFWPDFDLNGLITYPGLLFSIDLTSRLENEKVLNHSKVHAWYHGTILTDSEDDYGDGTDDGIEIIENWYLNDERTEIGYNKSLSIPDASMNVYNVGIPFSISDDANLNIKNIFNGDLSMDAFAETSNPGWAYHNVDKDEIDDNHLHMDFWNGSSLHNLCYFPANAKYLTFWMMIDNSGDDLLELYIGDQFVEDWILEEETELWSRVYVDISDFQGSANTFEFKIKTVNLIISTSVLIDDLEFILEGNDNYNLYCDLKPEQVKIDEDVVFAGLVLNENSEPIQNIGVFIKIADIGYESQIVFTDENGHYELTVPAPDNPGNFTVSTIAIDNENNHYECNHQLDIDPDENDIKILGVEYGGFQDEVATNITLNVRVDSDENEDRDCNFWIEPNNTNYWDNYPTSDSKLEITLNTGEHQIQIPITPKQYLEIDEIEFKAEMPLGILGLTTQRSDYKQKFMIDRLSNISTEEANELALQYLPILKFDGTDNFAFNPEIFHPKDINMILSEGSLKERNLFWFNKTIIENPTYNDLFENASSDYYLDNPLTEPSYLLILQNPALYETLLNIYVNQLKDQYLTFKDNYQNRVYATVYKDNDNNKYIIQYWFYYYFNDFYNIHEGEWEGITLVLNSLKNPEIAAFNSHTSALKRPWTEVEKIGNHPVVYVANGSHASYFNSGTHSSEIELEIFDDLHYGNGDWLVPDGVNINNQNGDVIRYSETEPVKLLPRLTNLEEFPNEKWVAYSGKWGGTSVDVTKDVERGSISNIAFPSSYGPAFSYDGNNWMNTYNWVTTEVDYDPVLELGPIPLGLAWLREQQNTSSGYWSSYSADRVGITGLALQAFLAEGYHPDEDETVQKGITYLLTQVKANGGIYNWSDRAGYQCAMALTALKSAAKYNPSNIAEINAAISGAEQYYVMYQWPQGGWRYRPHSRIYSMPDLSVSQWPILALKGVNDEGMWNGVRTFLHNYVRNANGGYGYANKNARGTMTCAGIWGEQIAEGPQANIEAAFSWLENSYGSTQQIINAYDGTGAQRYYYMYSLAKACALSNKSRLAGENWYNLLSDKLVNAQILNNENTQGHWSNGYLAWEPDVLATAFALLSLQAGTVPPGSKVKIILNEIAGTPKDGSAIDGLYLAIYNSGLFAGPNENGEWVTEIPNSRWLNISGGSMELEIDLDAAANLSIEIHNNQDVETEYEFKIEAYQEDIEGIVDSAFFSGVIPANQALGTNASINAIGNLSVYVNEPQFFPQMQIDPASLDISPLVNDTSYSFTFSISEIGDSASLTGVDIYSLGLTDGLGHILDSSYFAFTPKHFDAIPAGGSVDVNCVITIPDSTTFDISDEGLFTGNIIIESYRQSRSISITADAKTCLDSSLFILPSPMSPIMMHSLNINTNLYLYDFDEGYGATDVDLASLKLNDSVSFDAPILIDDFQYVPLFGANDVIQIHYNLPEFLACYGWLYDSTNVDYFVTGKYSDSVEFDLCGTVLIIGHRSGDLNLDGESNISDLTLMIDFLFRGSSFPAPEEAADINKDGHISITDLTEMINILFMTK